MDWTTKHLRAVILPLLWLNWVFGLVEIPLSPPRPIESAIYLLAKNTYFTYAFYKSYAFVMTLPWHLFESVVYGNLMILRFLTANIAIILNLCNSKKLEIIVSRCERVDETLEKFEVKKNYNILYRKTVILVSGWIVVEVLVLLIDIHWSFNLEHFGWFLFTYVSLQYTHLVISVADFNFILYFLYIRNTFKKINGVITSSLKHANNRFYWKNARPYKVTTTAIERPSSKLYSEAFLIETMKQLHLELCKVSCEINAVFSIQLLLETFVYFCQILLGFYSLYFYFGLLPLKNIINRPSIVSNIMWIMYYTTKLFLVNNTSSRVKSEAEKTGNIIRELSCRHPDGNLNEEIHQFSLQILLKPLTLNATGFFNLGEDYISRFLGTVATYLVILIQMTNMPNAIRRAN